MNPGADTTTGHNPESPRNRPYVTYALIGINVLMLLLMVVIDKANPMMPDSAIVLKWGANNRFYVYTQGEWWRLFTHMFEHFGILHLAVNMYALFQVGPLLELNFGRWRLVLFYLLAGLTGAFASNWWFDFAIGAGASGAVFGLFGALGALATTRLVRQEYRMSILKNLGVFLAVNLAIGFQSGMIDNAAHIGGFAGGVLAAYGSYFALRFPHRTGAKASGIALPVLFCAAVCIPLFLVTPSSKNPEVELERINQRIRDLEPEKDRWMQAVESADSTAAEDTALLAASVRACDTIVVLTDSMLSFELTPFYDKDFRLYRALTAELGNKLKFQQRILRGQVDPESATGTFMRFNERIDSLNKALTEWRKTEKTNH